jgi:hypothetical protein
MNSLSNSKICLLMTKNLNISPVYLSKLWLLACEIHFWAGVEANRSAISSLTIAFARLGNVDTALPDVMKYSFYCQTRRGAGPAPSIVFH